jgi:hypothetical protein
MSTVESPIEPPRGHVKVVYLGSVAPHWEVQSGHGDKALIDDFRQRVLARLLLLPKYDPQFRRNSERIVRDAQRENLILEWELGDEDDVVAVGPAVDIAEVANQSPVNESESSTDVEADDAVDAAAPAAG